MDVEVCTANANLKLLPFSSWHSSLLTHRHIVHMNQGLHRVISEFELCSGTLCIILQIFTFPTALFEDTHMFVETNNYILFFNDNFVLLRRKCKLCIL